MAGYPLELFYYNFGLNIGTQGKAHKPADRLCLARGTSTCLPHMGKEFEQLTMLIFVYRDINIPAACLHMSCLADNGFRPLPRHNLCLGRQFCPAIRLACRKD